MSVLIPVRNAEATIGAAIDSVLSQDYNGSVEIIVADRSDTTATADLIRRTYRYRLGGAEGPVDTVFLGAFRRDALEAAGGFDPAFVRNQDYELNWRLRARGETVWFDPELSVAYRPRGTLRDLVKQYFNYGRWKRVVARRHPASLLPRHLASPVLLLGLAVSLVMAALSASWTAAAAPIAYILTLVLASLTIAFRRRSSAALLLPLVLAAMHLSWGVGFFTPVRVRSTEAVSE